MTAPICKTSLVATPDEFCGAAATVPVTVGCVHEHVIDSHACPEHAPDLDSAFCRVCFIADGHKCRLSVLAGVA